MKILSRRSGPARDQDMNGDGVADGRDSTTVADRATTARPLGAGGPGTLTTVGPDPTLERTVDLDGRPGRPLDEPDADRRNASVALGPKPRTSLLATLGLIVSVVGALFVLSGTLAGYGIGLGAVGAVLAVLGLVATRRRHVAGTTDALIGVVVGLAAVVLGIVAMTGRFDWPTADGEWVGRFPGVA